MVRVQLGEDVGGYFANLFPEVGGIQRIGKQNIIFRIGK